MVWMTTVAERTAISQNPPNPSLAKGGGEDVFAEFILRISKDSQ